ncbi:MAG: hypothetical protein ACXVPU_07200 [Bacteroidia bacterium]
MEEKTNFIEPLLERAEEYAKTSYELFKLKALDKTADVLSTFISRLIFILTIILFVMVITIGVSLWLGDILGKSYYGFFCVAGFYAVMALAFYFFMHKGVKKQVGNLIVSQALN